MIEIDDKKFLKGKFLSRIQEIFKENINSGERIILKDLSFIESLANLHVSVDKTMVEKIINLLEKELGFKLEEIPKKIREINLFISIRSAELLRRKKEMTRVFFSQYCLENKEYCLEKKLNSVSDLCYLNILKWLTIYFFKNLRLEGNDNLVKIYIVLLYNIKEVLEEIKSPVLTKAARKFKKIEEFSDEERDLFQADDFGYIDYGVLREKDLDESEFINEEKSEEVNFEKETAGVPFKLDNLDADSVFLRDEDCYLFFDKKNVVAKLSKLRCEISNRIKSSFYDSVFCFYSNKIYFEVQKDPEQYRAFSSLNSLDTVSVYSCLDEIGSNIISK